ncbi:ATP-binding cassette domain-containing protein [Lapidilactobacillus wuchangensis]|uniref:ATP-binding cassette domain-containing protein n=1 Tax=Lapidilactobacillus wuchangensis TaxID=2486001 RepID=UPI000F7A2F7A|nr:ABC transporter ATP-binding protein [Lapidilactobacillus wuchangensis]
MPTQPELPTIGVKDLFKRVHKTKFIYLAVVTVINSFISLTFALITTWASQMGKTSTTSDVLLFCAKGLELYLVVYLGLYLTEIVTNSILKEACVSLEMDCMRHYLNSTTMSEDEIVSLVSQDVRMIRESFYGPILTLPTYILRAVIPIGYLLMQNIWVGLCFTIGALLMMIPQHFMSHQIAALGNGFSNQREVSLAAAIDVAKGRSTINNNQAQPFFMSFLTKKFTATESSEQLLHNRQALMFSLSGPLKGIADVVPFAIGIYLMHLNPAITIILLVAMLGTADTLKGQFQQIIYLSGDLLETKEVRHKFGRVLTPNIELNRIASEPTTQFDQLVVTNVSKQFDDQPLFTAVNFRISANDKVLLTGESGTGKSTLLDLLMQNQTPDSGQIYLLNGDQQIADFHNAVALISQRPHIFNLSIRDNILLGKSYSDAAVLNVLKKVRLDTQLGADPLNFEITGNGANISGGQQIKLEIARALINQKQLILADEITANLDQPTAKMIRDLLLTLPVTVIEVAHHYSDLSYYNLILHIENHSVTSTKNNGYSPTITVGKIDEAAYQNGSQAR